MAKSYTKLRYLRDAIKRCPEVKLTYVPYTEYVVIGLDDWKALKLFDAIPKSYHAEWEGDINGFNTLSAIGSVTKLPRLLKQIVI